MSATPILGGIIASMVTNFTDQSLDTIGIAENLEYLVAAGVDGVCVAGGTAEALSLSDREFEELVSVAAESVAGRCRLIVGALDLDPAKVAAKAAVARRAGADAVMIVPPYFISPSERTVDTHLRRLADEVAMPLIVFNTPARAGVDLKPAAIVKLAEECPNVVAIKDSSGSMLRASEIIRRAPDGFAHLQGFDELVLPSLAIGAAGALVSLATVMPRTFVKMVALAANGEYSRALGLHRRVEQAAEVVYLDTNPIGLKQLLDFLGRRGGPVRAPITGISDGHSRRLLALARRVEKWEAEAA